MKLKSFGCSFIWGTDLTDSPDITYGMSPMDKHSKFTWPALLAKHFDLEYECHARPGSGNLQIAERVLNECQEQDNNFFVIGWTFIDRFDYSGQEDMWQPWSTLGPGSESAWTKHYWANLHSEYRDKLTSLMNIKTVIDTLKQKNIRFLMTHMDDLLFDQQWHTTPAVKLLQDFVQPYITVFEGKSFLDWAKLNNFPISAGNHPLEEAHKSAYNLIINLLDHNNLDTKVKTI